MDCHGVNICALVLKLLFTLEGEFGKEFLSLQGFDQKKCGALPHDESIFPIFALVKCLFNSKTEYGGCSGNIWLSGKKKQKPSQGTSEAECIR